MSTQEAARTLDVRPVTLEGAHARLEPLGREHLDAMVATGADESIWTWMSVRPEGRNGFARWLDEALAQADRLAFAIIERASGELAGSTSYLAIEAASRRLEIGWTWLAPRVQRTAVNTECKYLLLRHAFETLGCLRVELRTDARNARSRAAILRIGAKEEGVLRKRQLSQHGYQRDDVYFSIIDDEWPDVKVRLEAMLAR
jgi:RimJ/RimL family protein N-acetyltransferase